VQKDLEAVVDVLAHFAERLAACNGDVEKQHQLVNLIVERVYINGDKVDAITLKSDYHIVLARLCTAGSVAHPEGASWRWMK
jgi:hypothetical protein